MARTPRAARGRATFTLSTPANAADITASGRIWRYDGIKRSVSTAAIANGLLFIADTTGYLHWPGREHRKGLLDP